MRAAVASMMLLLSLLSSAAAQGGGAVAVRASITDAELEVLCSGRIGQQLEALPGQVATGVSIEDLKNDLGSLDASERKARAVLNDKKSTSVQRTDAEQTLESVPEQRRATEQTLRDMDMAAALGGVQQCLDAARTEQVCAAYAARRPISWTAAQAIAACMRKPAPEVGRALRSLEPRLLTPEAPRALTGTSLENAVLRGTADFIIQRSEQELAMFAAQVMSRELCDKPTVASLLSRTCALIDDTPAVTKDDSACTPDKPNEPCEVEEQEPLFAVTLAALREAVRADLAALPTWLAVQLAKKPATRPAACALEVGWKFSERVLHGADVAETLWDLQSIVDQLKGEEPCKSNGPFVTRLEEVIAALRLVSTLKGVDVDGLTRSGDFDSLVSRASPTLTRDIAAPGRAPDTQLTDTGKVVREVLRRLRELQRAIENMESAPTGPNRAAAVIAALRTVEPLLGYASDDAIKAAGYVDTITEIVENIGSHQYIPAVVTLANSQLLVAALGTQRVGRNFHRLITLSASIAQADSSDAVKAALEEAAAPLQSWRRKDIPRLGATLTGFAGLGLAYELPVEKTHADARAPAGGTFAPTLMLGVDVHRGLGGSRLGVLVNVLDLGALATVRLSKPEASRDRAQAEQEPDVRFEQVFAPGLYPYFGWGPFDLGLGAGFVPSLRPARDSGSRDIDPLNILRFGGFIAVDVSILPLF